MENRPRILVTGVTGNQGGAVANHLLQNAYMVSGLTRNRNSIKAQALLNLGLEIIEADLDQPKTYLQAINSAESIFFVQTLQGKEKEIAQGKEFINAAASANIQHFVYASVLGADLSTGVPHFDSKYELENHLKSTGLDYTILRPASFFENHLFPRVANDIKKGKYVSPLNKDSRLQMISIDAIGKIANQVISNRDRYLNKTLSIATDEYTVEQLLPIFSDALGKSVKYSKLPGLITRLALGKDLYKMFKYMNENDFCVVEDVDVVRKEFGIEEDFKSWVNKNFLG